MHPTPLRRRPALARTATLLAGLLAAAPLATAAALAGTPEPTAPQAGEPDEAFGANVLVARLARPAPARIDFREVRFSPLLSEPLIVSGVLSYVGPDSFEREVTTPYRERTRVRGESVRVEREDEPPRSFALKRAPELRGLLSGFTALLAGDIAALQRSFHVELTGNEHAWTLELRPLERRARLHLQDVRVYGREDVPRCFVMHSANGADDAAARRSAPPVHAARRGELAAGAASVLLLGSAAHAELPRTGQELTLEALTGLCRAG